MCFSISHRPSWVNVTEKVSFASIHKHSILCILRGFRVVSHHSVSKQNSM